MRFVGTNRGVTKIICLLLSFCFIFLSFSGCTLFPEYKISGRVATSIEDHGVAGVMIEFSGDTSGFVFTDENGNWEASVSGTVTVKPKQNGLQIEPDEYTVSSTTTELDFLIDIQQHSHGVTDSHGEVVLPLVGEDELVLALVDEENGNPVDQLSVDAVVIGDIVAVLALDPSGAYAPSIKIFEQSELEPFAEIGTQAVFTATLAIGAFAFGAKVVSSLTTATVALATSLLVVVGSHYVYEHLLVSAFDWLVERVASQSLHKGIILYLPGQSWTNKIFFPPATSESAIEEILSQFLSSEPNIHLHSYKYDYTYIKFLNYDPDFEPEPYDIWGWTLDENDEPIAGATISFYVGDAQIRSDEITDEDGYWQKEDLLGAVEVRPSKAGIQEWVPPTYTAFTDEVIPFIGSRESTTGSIAGRVRDALTNNNIEGVQVDVYCSNSVLVGHTETDNIGEFYMSIPVGSEYQIELSHHGYLPVVYRNVNVILDSTTHLPTVLQIDEEHAGEGAVSGVITNAIDGQGINGLTIKLREGMNTYDGPVVVETETGSGGSYFISNLPAGQYTAEITAENYINDFFHIICIGGTEQANQNYSISPILDAEELRIVLTWGATPSDLDAHLTGPKVDEDDPSGRFHIYWWNRSYSFGGKTYADLDRDEMSGYGPETITIYEEIPGLYRCSVHDYSNRHSTNSWGLADSDAQVEVYQGDARVATFHVPNKEGTLWTVFTMEDSIITPVNEMSYESSPDDIQGLLKNKVYDM